MTTRIYGLVAALLLVTAPASAQQATGRLTAAEQVAQLDTAGMSTASITVSGTYSGTVAFEVVGGLGSAAVTVDCATPAAPGSAVNSTTSTGTWVCPVAGMSSIQARMSAYTSGTAAIQLVAAPAAGQTVAAAGGGGSFDGVLLDAAGGDSINDTTNNALRTNCVVGCAAATSDADDASIAAGQTNSNSNALAQVYDGSVWRRLTIGAAGTASAQVLTVQGIASMTPLLVSGTNIDVQIGGSDTVAITGTVTANAGTNLNTSALLTTAAFQTAFGTGSVVSADPCDGAAKTVHVVNTSTATTVEIANAVSGQFFYICSINLVAAGAQTVAIVEDDTDGVGSPTAGLNGGTAASAGWSFAANGGIALGNGGSTVMKTGTANRYLGIITGQAVQLSGTITYVSAP